MDKKLIDQIMIEIGLEHIDGDEELDLENMERIVSTK